MERSGTRAERTARFALVSTFVVAGVKVGLWVATGSLAVLSSALDSVLDIASLGLVFVAVRIGGRPADETHHYGHQKAENLGAFTHALFLGALVVWVAVEAVMRIGSSATDVHTPVYAFAILATAVVVDAWRARTLVARSKSERSAALEAGALNLVTDVGTGTVALVSLILVHFGTTNADPVGALVVAVAVLFADARQAKRAVDVLMDRAPAAQADAISAAAARAPGVAETRRVRVRGTGDKAFADVTVAAGRTTSLERAHDIAGRVEEEIARAAPGVDVVVHVEPASETSSLVERALAAATRTDGVHEVHNVQVHAFNDGGRSTLHATLHAKADPGITLANAHDLSERIEQSVRAELGDRTRVDTHLEPMESTIPGRDVTASYPDLVDDIRKLALQEPDVIDCHEVLLTAGAGELSVVAHVRGRRDLPLHRIHDASTRIEKAIHRAHPEVGAVVIHFEPT
jgi:cation diffusion facilitator family transporter